MNILLIALLLAAPDVKECAVPGVTGPARCGTMQVWENRDAKIGRKINLKFIVLPATAPGPVKEALVFLSGGPGQAATEGASSIARQFAKIRDQRDLLFMDQRGTGGSNPLPCEAGKPGDLQSYLKEFYTQEEVTQCAAKLGAGADLTQYTSLSSADDLDELRAALGYEQLDLFGVSYGTRAALEYVRRHPEHVRAVLMHGAAPNDTRYPLTVPRDSQLAIDGVFADCGKDSRCHRAFPDPAGDLAKSLRWFDKGPVRVPVLNGKTGQMTTVMFARDRYSEALRALMYDAGGASLIPALVHRAAQGDFGPAAEEELAWRMGIDTDLSRGLHLAVTCSEDVDFIDLNEAEEIAKTSFMSAFRARDQKAGCAVWPHRKLDKSVLEPIRADVPLLIMNGEDDPATARYHAERLLKGFPNGKLVVIPGAGHSADGLVGTQPCVDNLALQFIRGGDAKALDASCIAAIHRPPFPLRFPEGKVVALKSSEMSRFAGSYSGAFPVELVMRDGRLHALAPGAFEITLLPTGPARFRSAESPHVALIFQSSKGKVTGFELADGGAPVEKFVRSFDRQANQVR
jgi:pimeloyl-ACP methyl ester carboxylesterase